MAATRNGPPEPVVTALTHHGIGISTSVLAAASVTNAIVIPAMPVSATANATRASCTDPRTEDSAVSSALRIAPMKCRKMKPASSITKALMRPFHWLSCAQFVQS